MCDRISGSKWGAIVFLVATVALLTTLVPHRVEAQTTTSLVIETIPPIEGVTFRLNGEKSSTDEDGVAIIDPVAQGSFELRTKDRVLLSDSQRIEFAVWSDGVAESNRSVDIEGSTRLQVGFRVDYLVAETFRTSEGDVLKPKSVGPYVIVDDSGESTTFPGSSRGLAGPTAQVWERFPAGTRWLPAVRIVSENGRLRAEEASYSVRSVTVEGERMSVSPTQFTPSQGAEWGIEVDTSGSSRPRELLLIPLLIGLVVIWLLAIMLIRKRSLPSVAGVHNSALGLVRRRKPVKEWTRGDFVRVTLRSGRTVEGWRFDVPGADPSEALILSVAGVWGPDGTRVTSQPMDSLLLPSQIMEIQTFEKPPLTG